MLKAGTPIITLSLSSKRMSQIRPNCLDFTDSMQLEHQTTLKTVCSNSTTSTNNLHNIKDDPPASRYLCHPGRFLFSPVCLWWLLQAAVWVSRENPASDGPLTWKADVCTGSPLAGRASGLSRSGSGGCSPSCWWTGRSTEFVSPQEGPHSRPRASSWPPASRRGNARVWSSPAKTNQPPPPPSPQCPTSPALSRTKDPQLLLFFFFFLHDPISLWTSTRGAGTEGRLWNTSLLSKTHNRPPPVFLEWKNGGLEVFATHRGFYPLSVPSYCFCPSSPSFRGSYWLALICLTKEGCAQC